MIGIGDVASGISIAKEGYSIFRFFKKKGLGFFKKNSFPLDWFAEQELTIICSSLLAPPQNQETNYYSLFKPYSEDNVVPVGSGFFVTGIYDALALSKLSIALIEKKAVLSIGIDTIREDVRKENLCLIGGPASNLIGNDINKGYLPAERRFYAPSGGLLIHGNTFHGGEYGHILFMSNPWNNNKKILWCAGLGPFGTGAAVDFLINDFKDKAPNDLSTENNWVLFVQGVSSSRGEISEINLIGYSFL